MRFQGIIFDFNGVLWWDGHLQAQSWRQFSAELRGWPLSAEELAVHVHGRNNGYTLEYLLGRPVVGEELRALTQQKETIYRQLCLDEGEAFKLSPGAEDLLDFLAARQIPRTIATASEKTNLGFFVAHLHLDRWFDVGLIVYDDGSRPGKPAPDIYLQAAQNLGLAPAHKSANPGNAQILHEFRLMDRPEFCELGLSIVKRRNRTPKVQQRDRPCAQRFVHERIVFLLALHFDLEPGPGEPFRQIGARFLSKDLIKLSSKGCA